MSVVRYVVENKIGRIWVDRPKALNALNREVIDELDRLLTEIAGKKEIKVLIVGGESNFAAGADIKELVDLDCEGARKAVFTPTFQKIADLPIPSIAAIDGFALGGGLELALSCDLRVATERSRIGLPEVGIGIMPGAGGTIRLPRLVGASKAMEMILLNTQIDGKEAERIGLVNAVVDNEALMETVMSWANKLLRKPLISVETAKRTIRNGMARELSDALVYEAEEFGTLFATHDQKEGMRAFIEKRRPEYTDS